MELFFVFHHIVSVIKAFARAIDKLFQKSPQRAIPDLDFMLQNPHDALDHREIVIGPARNFGTALFAALGVGFLGHAVGTALFLWSERLPGFQWINLRLILVVCLTFDFACIIYFFRSHRGGNCTLTHEGVAFRYRNRVVQCPWEVFDAWGGTVYLKDKNLLLLPISSQTIDKIQEINPEEGAVQATGLEVKTAQWTTRSPSEASLRDLYEVNVERLGELFLTVGRKLGPTKSLSHVRKSGNKLGAGPLELNLPEHLLATKDDNGWIRMNLTAFSLPPFCCVCTRPTKNCHEYYCPNPGEQHYVIHVPTCKSCRLWFKLKKTTFIICTFFIILGIGVGILAIFNPTQDQARPFAPLVCLSPFFGSWVLTFFFFRLPITVRYSSKQAVLRMRFRNPVYEEMVLSQKAWKS